MVKKRVNLNLDPSVVDKIDEYARLHFMNRSSAISVLCSQSLNSMSEFISSTNNKNFVVRSE